MDASIAQDDKSIGAIMEINAIVDQVAARSPVLILSDHVPFEGLFGNCEVKPRDH
jgi:hypothetical protein